MSLQNRFVFDPGSHFSFSSQLQPNNWLETKEIMNIFLQFLRALRHCLDQHLHLQYQSHLGIYRLTITPWDQHTLMKIHLVLSWVEGGRVMYLRDDQVNLLFKEYCIEWCSNHYNLRDQGVINIRNQLPE